MRSISLVTYLHQSVEDDYAMNVLYQCLKKRFLDIGFASRDMDKFVLDGRFHGEPICLLFRTRYKTPCHSLALLLSLRALMCKKKCIELCEDDNLIFSSRLSESFQWIFLTTFIMDNWDDDEIKMLYLMMESIYFNHKLSEDEIRVFKDSIAIPEYKNEYLYYQNLSAQTKGVGDIVIGNNAFVDADIDRFVVHKDIEYVGNTAFAFCNNLHTLVFEGKAKFGTFPIIECPNLFQIVVPKEHIDYYKTALPFYEGFLCTEETILKKEIKVKRRPRIGETKESSDLTVTTMDVETKEQVPDEISLPNSENGLDVVRDIIHERVEVTPNIKEETACINPKLLEKVFDKKVTSYKYLWLIAILTLAKESGILSIPFKDLTIRMAGFAWPLLFDDDIDFGKTDLMRQYLNDVMKKTSLIPTASQKVVESYMRQHYDSQGISKILSPLLKNVPYRFLSPWIKYTTTEEVIAKSNAKGFSGLYAIQKDSILLDEDWWEYIEENYDKIYSFALNSLVDYVSHYNSPMKLIKLKMKIK